ncbi:MAG: HAD family hydrolase [Lachnospiraceae bacterium]|nr:HAD family hydrolase [Lachnospiraceae bacterium]
MIKAVIFDMFETLVTMFAGRTYYSENIAADVGVPTEKFRTAWHMNEMDRSTGVLTMEEGVARTLSALGVSSDYVPMICQKRRDALGDTFAAIPPASIGLLQELKARGILVGLISNCFSDEAEMIKNSRIYQYFDAVKLSYEQGICKPDPAMYYRIAAELGVEPEECLYVGDGGSNELAVAKEIGMKPVQALWFRPLMFEPHIPSPVFDEYPHAEIQPDVLNYL